LKNLLLKLQSPIGTLYNYLKSLEFREESLTIRYVCRKLHFMFCNWNEMFGRKEREIGVIVIAIGLSFSLGHLVLATQLLNLLLNRMEVTLREGTRFVHACCTSRRFCDQSCREILEYSFSPHVQCRPSLVRVYAGWSCE